MVQYNLFFYVAQKPFPIQLTIAGDARRVELLKNLQSTRFLMILHVSNIPVTFL